MIKTEHLLRLVKAAHKLERPGSIGKLTDTTGWVYVKDYEKYSSQVDEIKKALELLQKDVDKPKKGKKCRST